MFNPDGCFCCNPPEDPCTLSGCTWSSTDMSDTDLTDGVAYRNAVSGTTPDGSYEITNAQETGTGNDAPCRKITIETVEAPQKPDTVYAICWKDNATHNPATQCPLTSVSFCVESKRHGDSDSGLTDSVVFVVRQNNRIYATAAQSVGVNWKRASGTYTQSNFTEIDGAGNPNFTPTGTAIEFGFALKLAVSEDEEPLDVVMFDNLCVTRSTACSGCDTSNCDVLNNGSPSMTLVKEYLTSGGVIDMEYSVSSSVGNPPDSHRVRFSREASGTNSKIVYFTTPCDLSNTCLDVSSVTICFDLLGEGDSGYLGLTGYARAGIYQDGLMYFDAQSFQVAAPSYAKIGNWRSSSIKLPLTGRWVVKDPNDPLDPTVVTTTGPDLSQPFEIAMQVGSGGGLMAYEGIVYVDNICVKVVYGNCPHEWSVDFSGATITPPTKPGAVSDAAWAAAWGAAEDVLDYTVGHSSPSSGTICSSLASATTDFTGSWSGHVAGAPWGTTAGEWSVGMFNSLSSFTATVHKITAIVRFTLTSYTGTPPFQSGWAYYPGFQGRVFAYDLAAWPCDSALAATNIIQSNGFSGDHGTVDVSGASVLIYRS